MYLESSPVSRIKRICILVFLLLLAALMAVDRIFPYSPTILYSTQVKSREGDLLHAFLSPDDKWRMYADFAEITPLLRETFLFKEDKYFYYHPGVNPLAVLRAMIGNSIGRRKISGASTITMQVVRMLEQRPRTYKNKVIEIWNALRLERQYSKDEILQMYFNLVPFGGNIEGIKAASVLYFGKPPQLLSLAEIASLTVIPNNPVYLNPRHGKQRLLSERNKWLTKFKDEGLFRVEAIEDALDEPISATRREAPRQIPHLSLRLKAEYPSEHIIVTTVRQTVQSGAEILVSRYINRIRGLGIHNAAVMVLNNETMEVEGYVGSADFRNKLDGGQVDGVRAVRSPGSTLKPFLYASVLDKGLYIPKSILHDVPSNFGGYEPENFDLKFKGPVTLEFALANSLNIPAVRLLKEIQVKTMVDQLKKAGFRTVAKQSEELGLSLILGGCGATLEELTRLYAVFAKGGEYGALRYIQGAEKQEGIPGLWSEESAYMITQILSQADRPDLPNNFDNTYRLPRVAWKTGTSYGKRDAWSIGYNTRYTIGVWVGNFSGAGVPELSGANIATPLLFDLFNTVDYNASKDWFVIPAKLEERIVCSHTGDVPTVGCSEQIISHAITGVSAFRRCEHQRQVFTDEEGKISYCGYCLPAGKVMKRSYPNLAPELIAFYHHIKLPYPKIPPHNPGCGRVFAEGAPEIVSPAEGVEYLLPAEDPTEIQLLCQAAQDVDYVTWFVNDRLLKKARSSEPVFFVPPAGAVKISCVDDKGRNTDRVIFTKRF